jgi:hypothetical protein
MPVTFVEVSTEAIAAALVEQIQKQLKGVPVTHRMIRPALVEGALRPVARNIIRKKSSVIRKP